MRIKTVLHSMNVQVVAHRVSCDPRIKTTRIPRRIRANTGAKFFPMGRLFDICVDTHVEKNIYLNTKEKTKNHDSYK